MWAARAQNWENCLLIAAFNTIGGFSVNLKITDEFGVCENS